MESNTCDFLVHGRESAGRVSACLTRSLSLLRSAEYHFRLHNTDAAVLLLTQAEVQLTTATDALPCVPDEQRFALQKRVNQAHEEFDDFRLRMSEV